MNRLKHLHQKHQQGAVSLFSVIFFTLLTLVITLGFVRLMLFEQRQSTDDTLSATALAAAESGVEDAKRALIKFNSLPIGSPQWTNYQSVLNSSACNAINTNAYTRGDLGLSADGTVSTSDSEQQYTCLKVRLNTDDYQAATKANESKFIPLRNVAGSNFNQLKVSWHLVSERPGADGDGTPQAYAADNSLPELSAHASPQKPAYLRLQLYGHPKAGSFSRDVLNANNRSLTLIPSTFSSHGGVVDIAAIDPKASPAAGPLSGNSAQPGVVNVGCNPLPLATGSYACSSTLALGSSMPSPTGFDYYLRVTPLYSNAHFAVQIMDNAATVQFNGVQPVIDSTGRTNDVFRRVETRVSFDSMLSPPAYGAGGADICKTMEIALEHYEPNACTP